MSFDYKKYLKNNPLLEDDGFDKNVWLYLTDEEKDEFADDIFNLIDTAYEPIGGNPNYKSPSDVVGSERGANYMVIDFDLNDKISTVNLIL